MLTKETSHDHGSFDWRSLLFSALFITLMILIPWESIWESTNGILFVDRENYRNIFLLGEGDFHYVEFDEFFQFFSYEYLWHVLILGAIAFDYDLEFIFGVVSFIAIAALTLSTIKSCPWWAVLFLANPLVVDFAFSQLRLAFAISILILAYFSRWRSVKIILSILTLSIHTASIIFIAIYFLIKILDLKLIGGCVNTKPRIIVYLVFIGFLLALMLSPLRSLILGFFGDRRAEYHDMSSSTLFLIPWLIFMFVGFSQQREFFEEFWNKYSFVILAYVSFNIALAGYSTRFIVATYPALLAFIYGFSQKSRAISFCLLAIYTLVHWLYWLKIL